MATAPTSVVLAADEGPRSLRRLGRGANALVLEVVGREDLLLKWYRRPLDRTSRQRLASAVAAGTDPARPHPQVCWPRSVVLDDDQNLRGCLIRRAAPGSVQLGFLSTSAGRSRHALPDGMRVRLGVVRAVAAIVERLHDDGWVVGDLHRENMMVRLAAGAPASVELVDSDGFWRADHLRWLADARAANAEGFAAPEILCEGAPPSELGDRFALAVLVFMVLGEARHPFVFAGTPHRTWDQAVAAGPPPARAFDTLPPALARLCRTAFVEGHSEPERRPCAAEWQIGLASLL